MSVRKTIPYNNGVYFITFTCARWLPLFEMCNGYSLVYKWFDILKTDGHYIIGYVIMPHHVHAVIAFKKAQKPINTIIANGKRFMAYDLVSLLKQQNKSDVLDEIKELVNDTDKKRNKLHEVFEPSFDWKECQSIKFIEQKLQYIHVNPCKCTPRLAVLPGDYVHSSARFYLTGEHGIYKVMSYMELQDIDLTK